MIIKTKFRISLFMIACCAFFAVSGLAIAADNTEIASYSIGFGTGEEMLKSSNVVDSKSFVDGLKDAFAQKQPAFSQDELAQAQAKIQEAIKKAMENSNAKSPAEISNLKLPENEKKIISYVSGYSFADQLGMMGDLFNYGSVVKGLTAALEGGKNPYSPAEQEAAMTALRQDFESKMLKQVEAAAKPQIEAGEKFIEDFSHKEGVKKTPEGLYYEEIKAGTGATPSATDTVKVHYTGSLIDGTVFDSSVQRDEPFVTNVSEGIIDGWKMVLPRMKVGDKWKVAIPQEYAYGVQGIPQAGILPGATLIFEIELLDIEK